MEKEDTKQQIVDPEKDSKEIATTAANQAIVLRSAERRKETKGPFRNLLRITNTVLRQLIRTMYMIT